MLKDVLMIVIFYLRINSIWDKTDTKNLQK